MFLSARLVSSVASLAAEAFELLGIFEKPKPRPVSIADSVLHKHMRQDHNEAAELAAHRRTSCLPGQTTSQRTADEVAEGFCRTAPGG